MSADNNENIVKMITAFIHKANLANRFQIFTKRTHYALFGISIFTACYTTFSFFMHKNMIRMEETMRSLRNHVTFDINDAREKHNILLSKIETIIEHMEEHHEKFDECTNSLKNASVKSDASTQTEEEPKMFILRQEDDIHHNELDNECYDIIPCNNIKKHHFTQ